MRILQYRFATRLSGAPVSFLDELFRVSADPSIISFAGGLPSSALIDTAGIARAAGIVLEEEGCNHHLHLDDPISSRYNPISTSNEEFARQMNPDLVYSFSIP